MSNTTASESRWPGRTASAQPGVARRRALLALGCLAAVALAASIGSPAARLAADPELAQLLRFMALVKAGIVLVSMGLLGWRFGQPISLRLTAVYLVGAWLAAGASMLVWQLQWVGAGAALFHAGELMLLVTAYFDRRAGRDPAAAGPGLADASPGGDRLAAG